MSRVSGYGNKMFAYCLCPDQGKSLKCEFSLTLLIWALNVTPDTLWPETSFSRPPRFEISIRWKIYTTPQVMQVEWLSSTDWFIWSSKTSKPLVDSQTTVSSPTQNPTRAMKLWQTNTELIYWRQNVTTHTRDCTQPISDSLINL